METWNRKQGTCKSAMYYANSISIKLKRYASSKTKEELIHLSKTNFYRLNAIIDAIPSDRLDEEFKDDHLNRNIRDVITHLHEWNLMLFNWYEVGQKGGKPAVPADGYTWKTLPDLNVKIWEKYQKTSLQEARKMFHSSFAKVFNIIESHSNNELFEKKKFKWTGTTSLAAYLISGTSSHYDWAIKKIKKAFK